MISCIARFPNCSRKCQSHSKLHRRVTILLEVLSPLQTNGCLEVECTLALKQMHPRFHHSTLTTMMLHFLCLYLLHIHHSLLVLSANCSFTFSWIGFLTLSLWGWLLISMFVYNILQIPSGCSACTCTPFLWACFRHSKARTTVIPPRLTSFLHTFVVCILAHSCPFLLFAFLPIAISFGNTTHLLAKLWTKVCIVWLN